MPEDAGLDTDYDTDRELALVQGTAAKVVPGTAVTVNGNGSGKKEDTVELLGRQFRVADKIGLMPLLKFSAFADVSTNDPRALGAMYALLRDCIHPGQPGCGQCEDCKGGAEQACAEFDRGDWGAFEDHAMAVRADADDLFGVISKVMELIAGRPTKPPASSSPGLRRTSARSTGSSSSRRAKGSRR
jgi:hypothetical protein